MDKWMRDISFLAFVITLLGFFLTVSNPIGDLLACVVILVSLHLAYYYRSNIQKIADETIYLREEVKRLQYELDDKVKEAIDSYTDDFNRLRNNILELNKVISTEKLALFDDTHTDVRVVNDDINRLQNIMHEIEWLRGRLSDHVYNKNESFDRLLTNISEMKFLYLQGYELVTKGLEIMKEPVNSGSDKTFHFLMLSCASNIKKDLSVLNYSAKEFDKKAQLFKSRLVLS